MISDSCRKSFAACAATAAFASGCVTAPVYHESWSAQVQSAAGGCPDVDGTYRNAGEAYEKTRRAGLKPQYPSLAHVLNEGYGHEVHDAPERLGWTSYLAGGDDHKTVRLLREGDVLHVTGTRAGGESRSFDLKLHGQCKNSLLPVESEWGYAPFQVTAVRGGYSLGRAEDGSLLVYGNMRGVSLGVIPGSRAFWVRFPPADTAPATVPAAPDRQQPAEIPPSGR